MKIVKTKEELIKALEEAFKEVDLDKPIHLQLDIEKTEKGLRVKGEFKDEVS